MQPFDGKIVLERRDEFPLCAGCGLPLHRIRWHKIRGGPSTFPYTVILSCAGCGYALEFLTGGANAAAAG